MLHYEAIDPSTLEVLKHLLQMEVFRDLRLVGGTSLALQLGHRKSVDIAAMKLSAITGRGNKKDFVDISFLLRQFSFPQMLGFYNQKYYDGSEFLVIKSLTYFEDADLDPDPVMLEKMDWELTKEYLISSLDQYL